MSIFKLVICDRNLRCVLTSRLSPVSATLFGCFRLNGPVLGRFGLDFWTPLRYVGWCLLSFPGVVVGGF